MPWKNAEIVYSVHTLCAKQVGEGNFGGEIFVVKIFVKNFGEVSTISVINFGGIHRNFSGYMNIQYGQH